jgi:O-acetyl-ADP-ribose deacetylase (regulator of RNase III)
MQFTLKAIAPELAEAFCRAFAGVPNVRVSGGDILAESADAIVSPANSFGYMDGSLDLLYSKYFGWGVEKRVRAVILEEHDNELPVGQAVLVETGHPRIRHLICAPTMRVPMDVSKTTNAYLAFRAVLRLMRGCRFDSVLVPGLGTGEGRMPPERCARQMRYAWDVVMGGRVETMGGLARAVETQIRLLR